MNIGKIRIGRFSIYASLLALSACAGKVTYSPPSSTTSFTNTKTVEKSRDDVWASLVPALGSRFFVINNLDKSSGLINVSYNGDPEKYVDCGVITSVVKNATGERTYSFPGSRTQQSYQMFTPGLLLLNINRRMELDGRINLVLEATTPQKTTATVNTRYVIKRDQEARTPDGRGQSASHTISFNGGGVGTFPSNNDQSSQCQSTGALEREILELIK